MSLWLPLIISFTLSGASQASTEQFNLLFGSCSEQNVSLNILQSVIAKKPDAFVFLGDNIYGDSRDMEVLKAKYSHLAANPNFQALKASTPLYAIWDDHDFGENDAGAEYPFKDASREIMLDFWEVPENSLRRTQQGGIYASYWLGTDEHKIHLILPDLRYSRSPLYAETNKAALQQRKANMQGPYIIDPTGRSSMLGDVQWQWLEKELRKPADLIIIGSSLQLVADFTGWESWTNYPADRERLFKFITSNKINGVMVISGDTHWAEISKLEGQIDYPIWDITSSGLSQEWQWVSPNKHRVGEPYSTINFGQIKINWSEKDPSIQFGYYDHVGEPVHIKRIRLSSISPYY